MPPKTPPKTADPWQVAHLHVAIFPTKSPRDIQQTWFHDLTGNAPAESSQQPHEAIAAGALNGATIKLTVDLLKVAFTITPQKPDTTTPSSILAIPVIPTIADPPADAAASLLGLVNRWLSSAQLSIKRIGFSGRLVKRANTHNAVYVELKRYLPTVDFDPQCSDLFFKINRRRKSKRGPTGLLLNRLATWSALKSVKIYEVQAAGMTTEKRTLEDFWCSLEFDVNTLAEYDKELPRSRMKNILRELADLALEISEKGDIR